MQNPKIQKGIVTKKERRSFGKMMDLLAPYMPKPDVLPPQKSDGWTIPEIRMPETEDGSRHALASPSGH